MDNKCRKEIARLWAGAILLACDETSFDQLIKMEDVSKIVEQTHKIGYKLIGNEPILNTLPQIINHVLDKYYE
jgi:hypothetical protein